MQDNDEPNPNWKIDKYRAYLGKLGRFQYKVMWIDVHPVYPGFQVSNGLRGRPFKSLDEAVKFATKKRILEGFTKVWIYEWQENRWGPLTAQHSLNEASTQSSEPKSV